MKELVSRVFGFAVVVGFLLVLSFFQGFFSGLGLPGLASWPLGVIFTIAVIAGLIWGWSSLRKWRVESRPGVKVWNALDERAFKLQKSGDFGAAAPLFEQAIPLAEATGQPIIIATAANNLASVYMDLDRWSDALPQFQRAYALRKQALGADDGMTLTSGERLSGCLIGNGRWADVEALQRELLAVYIKKAGADAPIVLETQHAIAVACRHQGRYAEALGIYQAEEARLRSRRQLESDAAGSLFNDWAYLLVASGSPADAVPVYDRAISIREKAADPFPLAMSLDNRADAQAKSGDATGAAVTSQRWFELMDRMLSRKGEEGQGALVQLLEQHAARLQAAGRSTEAEALRRRAGTIRATHPDAVAKFGAHVAQLDAVQ